MIALMLVGLSVRTARAGINVDVPDAGWRLWPDQAAAWADDKLFLPAEAGDVSRLPVNPPTGGWDVLNDKAGVVVTLPSTVEQHYWGAFGLRPCTAQEYGYAPGSQPKSVTSTKIDADAQIGNYKGVSWWWRSIDVPKAFHGKRVSLHIRGARQRAEVFLNRQLVGYDLIAETAFDCDVTKAIRPGQPNEIAIRITNPGGRIDWIDYEQLSWGHYKLPAGHGFGGIDRGITVSASDATYIDDLWVLNTAGPRTVTAHASVRNTTTSARTADVHFDVVATDSDAVLAYATSRVTIPPGKASEVAVPITCNEAQLWSVDSPRMYRLRARLDATAPERIQDEAIRPFGFRWIEPRGMGDQAGLYFNGSRVRLYTAISWSYWGFNGLWPTPELAEKEVRVAKQLHLNMLNFHRDIGREEVMAKQDELGLLRYMEPGGGIGYFRKIGKGQTRPATVDASGDGGGPQTFIQSYLLEKVTRMVREFRSHPSLAIYVLQNETEPDPTDPHLYYLLRRVHELDPSRVVAAKSGISINNQAWFAPYEPAPRIDDGTGYSGWRDRHTVGGPGTWQDGLYKSPTAYTHQIDDRKEIVDWGEMLGAAVPDNHARLLGQIQSQGGASYDLLVHRELADVYHRFLDKWGFRQAFPTDDEFYSAIGQKQYEFWGRVIETARLSESNDILSISGWESTSIENHSGLVDNMRNLRADPALISSQLAPLLPVVETRASTLRRGESTVADLFLLNETGRPTPGKLRLTLMDPHGASTLVGTYDVPAYEKDRFVYPVEAGVSLPALNAEGKYRLELSLDGEPKAKNGMTLLVIDDLAAAMPAVRVAVVGDDADAAIKKIGKLHQLHAEPYRSDQPYDMILAAWAIVPAKHEAKMDTGAPGAPSQQPVVAEESVLPATVLERVKKGTPLLVWVGEQSHASALAQRLADAGAFGFAGNVPTARASWMGNWVFIREHPLFAGLPINGVMKGDYQVPVTACYGLMVDGPGVEVIAGYGRDHDKHLGAATFTASLNHTPIVFQALAGMHPVCEQRWLENAILWLRSQPRSHE